MRKFFLYSFSILSLLAGVFLLSLFLYSFFNQYAPLSFKHTNTTVIHKKSEIRLSFFPKYYVYVQDENDASVRKYRVNKKTIVSTSAGDLLAGYKSNGNFFTKQQIIIDIIHTLIFTLVGIALFLLGILIFIRNTSLVRSIQKRLRSIRVQNDYLKWSKQLLFVCALFFIFGGQVLHFYQINVKQHDKATAEIIDIERKPEYGRYVGPTFSFTLNFDLSNDETIEAKIKVPKEIYRSYEEGNTLDILYQKKNPYYVSIP